MVWKLPLWLRALNRPTPALRRPGRNASPAFRPQVERLERRDLPSLLMQLLNPAPLTAGQAAGQQLTLATFQYTRGTAQDYSAAITWGDGTSTAGTVEETTPGNAKVVATVGQETYHHAGTFTVDVIITGLHASTSGEEALFVLDAPVHATGMDVEAVQGQMLGGGIGWTVPVTTFTDDNPYDQATDFVATIDWGNGQISTGVGVEETESGEFTVSGSTTYTEPGSATIQIQIHREHLEISGWVVDPRAVAAVNATATIAAQKIAFVNGGQEGGWLGGSWFTGVAIRGPFAEFADPAGLQPNGTYSATIDWGDGGGPLSVPINLGLVFGDHTYATAGDYTVTVTAQKQGQDPISMQETVSIADPTLPLPDILVRTRHDIHAVEGQVFDGVLAYVDGAPTGGGAFEPFASISSPAGVDWEFTNLTFNGTEISGRFTPTQGGVFTLYVGLYQSTDIYHRPYDSWYQLLTVDPKPTADLTVTVTGRSDLQGIEGQSLAGVLADVEDFNPHANLTASIAWGDGAFDNDVPVEGGIVQGQHTFTLPGAYLASVTVTDQDSNLMATGLTNIVITGQALTAVGQDATGMAGQEITERTVATFTTANQEVTAADLTAVINWGDGTTTTGRVSGSGGSFAVVAAHTYDEAGKYTARVLVRQGGLVKAVALSKMTVSARGQARNGLDADGRRFHLESPGRGETLRGDTAHNVGYALLATFTDRNPASPTGCHQAYIGWGDGWDDWAEVVAQDYDPSLDTARPAAYIRVVKNEDGDVDHYEVFGRHTYDLSGNFHLTVAVQDHSGRETTAHGTVTVDDPPITAQGRTLRTFTTPYTDETGNTAYVTNPLRDVVFASFTDAFDRFAFGRGSCQILVSGPGNLLGGGGAILGAKAPGRYWVAGDVNELRRGWAPGTYKLLVTIQDDDIANTQVVTTLIVADAGVNVPARMEGWYLALQEIDDQGVVDINWGDGHTRGGNLIISPLEHTFTAARTGQVSGAYTNLVNCPTKLTTSVTVVQPPVAATALPLVNGTEGETTTADLVAFGDPNPQRTAGTFTATVDWGDGTAETTATVTRRDTGLFVVHGDHTYAEEGRYTAIVRIADGDPDGNEVAVAIKVVIGAKFTADGKGIGAVIGVATGPVVVAQFAPPVADQGSAPDTVAEVLRDFTAVIEWGDGQGSIGTIRRIATAQVQGQGQGIILGGPGGPGGGGSGGGSGRPTFTYEVVGSHTYQRDGNYQVQVTLQMLDGLDGRAKMELDPVEVELHPWEVKGGNPSNELEQGHLLTLGEASLELNNGGLRLSQALDFDLSPGTAVGGDPVLVYDSGTVHVRPIIAADLRTVRNDVTPDRLKVQLIWEDGRGHTITQDPVTFDTTGLTPGNGCRVAVQFDRPLDHSGIYHWTLHVTADIGAEGWNDVDAELSGDAHVIVRDSTDADAPNGDHDPYGPGWGIAGVPRLVLTCYGALWADGTGDNRFFAYGANFKNDGKLTSPPEDFGTLKQLDDFRFQYTAKDQTKYTFDAHGLLREFKDRDGIRRTYDYDDDGRLTEVVTPDYGTTTLEYDGNGLLETIIEPGDGRYVHFARNAAGDLTGITDAGGYQRTLGYDADHRVVRDQWAPLDATFHYDAATGALDRVDRGLGTVYVVAAEAPRALATGPAADLDDSPAKVTDALDHSTKYTLDFQGRLLAQEDALGNARQWAYTDHGQVAWYLDARGNQTDYTYDYDLLPEDSPVFGDLIWVAYPDGGFQSYQYDPTFHFVTVEVNARGAVTRHVYDPTTGDLLRTTDALGNTTRYEWSDGLLRKTTDPLGHATTYLYGGGRSLRATVNDLGFGPAWTYDNNGNVLTADDGAGDLTTTTYDGANRLLRRRDGAQDLTVWTYTASGLVETEQDPRTFVTRNVYDQRGFTTWVVEAEGTAVERKTQLEYDDAGNLTWRTTGLADHPPYPVYVHPAVTNYEYDLADRLIATTEGWGTADQRATGTTYDAAGNVVTVTDGRGVTTEYQYDEMNRPREIIEALGTGVQRRTSQHYDLAGNLTSVTTGQGAANYAQVITTTYVYDLDDRQTRVTVAGGGVQQVTRTYYDAAGNVSFVIRPNGATDDYGYDEADRNTSIIEALGQPEQRITRREYDDANRLIEETRGLAVDNPAYNHPETTRYGHDGVGRVTTVTEAYGTDDQRTRTTHYDADGNVDWTQDGRGTYTVYGYDALDRRTSVTEAWGWPEQRTTTTYYDAADNVIEVTTGQSANGAYAHVSTTQYGYDALNQRRVEREAINWATWRQTTWTFDAGGNVLSETRGEAANSGYAHPETARYQYDALGRRTRVIEAADSPWQRTTITAYDAADNVTEVVSPLGRITVNEYDGLNRLLETYAGWGTADQEQTSYRYDVGGNLLRVTTGQAADPNYAQEATTVYAYDRLNRRIRMTDPVSGVTVTQYDAADNPYRVVNPRGALTLTTFDALNRPREIREAVDSPDRRFQTRDYDRADNLVSLTTGQSDVTDTAHPATTDYVYDRLNRRTHTQEADEGTYTLYDAADNLTVVIDPLGVTTRNDYDGLDRLVDTYEAVGTDLLRQTHREYDAVDNLVWLTTGLAADAALAHPSTTLTYFDDLNRPFLVEEAYNTADDRTTRYEYDAEGNVRRVTDPRGLLTETNYDVLGRRIEVRQAANAFDEVQSTFRYDAADNVVAVTQGIAGDEFRPFYNHPYTFRYRYDGLHRVIQATDPLGRITTTTYDRQGAFQVVIGLGGHMTRTDFDDLGRPWLVTEGMELPQNQRRVTVSTYDAADNLRTVQDPLEHVTRYDYDDHHNRTRIEDAEGGVTQLVYDADNRVHRVTDPDHNETETDYDALGRPWRVTDPFGAITETTYDAANNPITVVDRDNHQIQRTYDNLNRMRTEVGLDAHGVPMGERWFTYDADGNVLSAATLDTLVTQTFDGLNRLQTTTDTWGVTLTYAYDAASNLTQVQDTFGSIVASAYDGANRLTQRSLQGAGTPALVKLDYTDRDQLATVHDYSDLPAQTEVIQGRYLNYTGFGQVRQVNWWRDDDHVPEQFHYEYNLGGLLRTEDRQAARDNGTVFTPYTYIQDFGYDRTNQVTAAAGAALGYDAAGNRTGTGVVIVGNRLKQDRNTDYEYDGEGDLTARVGRTGDYRTDYAFDYAHHLVGVTSTLQGQQQWQVTYRYDAFGRRVERVQAGGATPGTERYVYQGGDVWADLDGTNHVRRWYQHGAAPDQHWARMDAALGQTLWYLQDRLGSVAAMVNSAGLLVERLRTKTFTTEVPIPGTGYEAFTDRYRFTGREYDAQTGLQYNRARWYDGVLGRFVSEDPSGFGGGDYNLYRYAGNSPTNATDPTGLFWQELWDYTGGLVIDVARLTWEDPSRARTFAAEARQGVQDGNTLAANAFMFGLHDGVRQEAERIQRENGGLYYVANAAANVSRDAFVGVFTAGLGGGGLCQAYTAARAFGAAGGAAKGVWQTYAASDGRATWGQYTGAVLTGGFAGYSNPVGTAVSFATAAAGYYGARGLGASQESAVRAMQVGDLVGGLGYAWRQAWKDGGWNGKLGPGGVTPGLRAQLLTDGVAATAGLTHSLATGGDWLESVGSAMTLTHLARALKNACFTGDMPLRVPGGSQRIDQIRVGDLVLSRDEHDPAGPVVAKVVEEVFVRQARVLHLHVRGQVIRTTAEHPFDAYDQGWTAAGQLREGDWLRTEAGDWAQVEEVFDTGETATVYNLRVADYHTYFVGCDEWGFSVWAHNAYDGAKQIGNDTVEGWARKWVAGHVDGKSPPLDLGAGRPTSKQWEGIRKWARANLQKEMADAGVPLPNNPGGGRGAVSTQELTGQWTDGLVAESQGRLLNGGGRSGGVARVERPLTGLDGRALSPDAHVLPTSGPMAGVEIYLQTVTVRGKTVNTLRDWERGNAVRLYEYGVNEGRPFEVVLIPKRDSGPFYRVVDGQIVEMPRPSNAQALLQQLAQLRAGG